MKIKKMFLIAALLSCASLSILLSSCEDEKKGPKLEEKGSYVVGFEADKQAYLMTVDNIEEGKISLKGKGNESIHIRLYPFKNKKAFLFQYRKGSPAGMQAWSFNKENKLIKETDGTLPGREEFIAEFNNYMVVSASTTLKNKKKGQEFHFFNGETNALEDRSVYLDTENLIEEGEYANFAGLVTIGDKFLSAVEPFKITTDENNSTAYPNRVWIAIFDKNAKFEKVIKDDRMSFAVGRRKSGRLSCIGKNESGDIYVFSPAIMKNLAKKGEKDNFIKITDKPSSVLKIDKNSLEFDKNYYFNIEEKSGGYKLQNVFATFGDYFLLNMYAEKEKVSNGQTANKMASFNVKTGDFKWIENLPNPLTDQIGGYSVYPFVDGKNVYLPMTAKSTSFIYKLDMEKATATKGLEIDGEGTVGGLAKLSIPTK